MTALKTFTTASKQPLTTGRPSRHRRYLRIPAVGPTVCEGLNRSS
jgi:hypothetical protein